MSNTTTPALSVDAALAAFSVALLHVEFEADRSRGIFARDLAGVRQLADVALYDMVGEQPRWDASRVDYVLKARDAASGRYVPVWG